MFTPLNFPKAELKLSRKADKVFVWDVFRKRKIQLTPEEWVRQHVLHYLINEKNVPSNLIVSEYGIKVNKMIRRCDGVVFDRNGNPLMIIECKAPEVNINEKVFHQIAQYNFELNVNWLVLTNGLDTVIAFINTADRRIDFLPAIPEFGDLIT